MGGDWLSCDEGETGCHVMGGGVWLWLSRPCEGCILYTQHVAAPLCKVLFKPWVGLIKNFGVKLCFVFFQAHKSIVKYF